jgi:type I restriction enzyme S subunit
VTDLPRGWTRVRLGEIVTPQTATVPAADSGRPYLGLDGVESGSTRVIGYASSATMRGTAKPFGPGYTLYSRLRPYLNKVCVPDQGGVGSTEFIVFSPSAALAPRYLLHCLNSHTFVEFANRQSEGIERPRLSWQRMSAFEFGLPPLAEQQRIVAAIEEHLSRLDAANTFLRRVRLRMNVLRARALETAFAGEWPWTTLGEIAEIVGGVTKDAKRQADPSFVEVPYLRVANVQRGFLDLTEVVTIRVPPDKAKALELRVGDVLFNEGGDRDKLGRGWIWSGEIEGCIHQNHVFRARLRDGFEPKFISWHGNTFGRRWFEERGRQTTNLASLNLTTLKSFPVPRPPMEEQRRVVAEVERQLSVADAMATDTD